MKPKMFANVDNGGRLLNCADRKKINEDKDNQSIVCVFSFFSPLSSFFF